MSFPVLCACPDQWNHFQDRCFFLSRENETFGGALVSKIFNDGIDGYTSCEIGVYNTCFDIVLCYIYNDIIVSKTLSGAVVNYTESNAVLSYIDSNAIVSYT